MRSEKPFVVRKIAILRALFLGDLVCSVPAWRALRWRFPEAEITLIGMPWARDFVQRFPYIDRLLPFPGYPNIKEVPYQAEVTAAFLAEARAYTYDIAIQMHGNGIVSNGFVADLGARASFGYRRGHDERLTMTLPWWHAEHEIVRWLRLVQIVGMWANQHTIPAHHSFLTPELEFPLAEHEIVAAAELLAQAPALPGPLVGLHIGGSDPARRWPPAKFVALADALAERWQARIVLTGGPGEELIAATVRAAMHAHALDLIGRTSLGVFAAVVKQLDLLVTNDTGASHIAATQHTRSVVLFGPSRPEGWAPLDRERHRVLDALAFVPHGTDPALALAQLPWRGDGSVRGSHANADGRRQRAASRRQWNCSEDGTQSADSDQIKSERLQANNAV